MPCCLPASYFSSCLSFGSEQVIQRAAEECNAFGLFILSLVGLDRNAANELFADFLAQGTHTPPPTSASSNSSPALA
jgi:hypothetical protein